MYAVRIAEGDNTKRIGTFRSEYEYEIEYEYNFQISNQLNP